MTPDPKTPDEASDAAQSCWDTEGALRRLRDIISDNRKWADEYMKRERAARMRGNHLGAEHYEDLIAAHQCNAQAIEQALYGSPNDQGQARRRKAKRMNIETTIEPPTIPPLPASAGSATVTHYHMSQSIEGPLINWPRKEWKRALKYMHKNDGSSFASVEELKQAFLDELAKGHKVVPLGECDNFDWEHGCQGHRDESPNDQGQGRRANES